MNCRERLLGVLYAAPRNPEVDERKRRFAALNEFISQRGGWMTSVPGAHETTFDALPGSPLPSSLSRSATSSRRSARPNASCPMRFNNGSRPRQAER